MEAQKDMREIELIVFKLKMKMFLGSSKILSETVLRSPYREIIMNMSKIGVPIVQDVSIFIIC